MLAEDRGGIPRSADSTGRGGLRIAGLEKSFGTVRVLHGVDVEVARGEIHALLGANGAGKSTLVKIVTGVLSPDAGTIEIDGIRFDLSSSAKARNAGIAVVFQDPPLFPDLDVGENIFAGDYPKLAMGLLDREQCYARAREVLARLGIEFDPRALVKDLSVAEREFVAIARALEGSSRVLLLDEPTASLTPEEVHRLFDVVRNYRDNGGAVIFISHRLDEVQELADRVTVLRDGHNVFTGPLQDISREQMAEHMLGRKLSAGVPEREIAASERKPVLSVRGLSLFRQFSDVSFDVHPGEIVVLAGLVGSGRTEVVEAVVGLREEDSGSVSVDGHPLRQRNPREMSRLGVVLVPEDRDAQGLVGGFSSAENIGMAVPGRASRWGFLRRGAERDIAREQLDALSATADATDANVTSLSGGTRQKVVVGKWLATDPKVLLLDEPTRGVDVGTKAELHTILKRLAREQHMAVLAVSSDLEEVVQLADRVLVMRRGRLVATLTGQDVNEQEILAAASLAESDAPAARPATADVIALPKAPPSRAVGASRPAASRTTWSAREIMPSVGRLAGPPLSLAVLALVFAFVGNHFATASNLQSILFTAAVLAIAVVGQGIVVISRNLDLSIGAVMASGGYLSVLLYIHVPAVGPLLIPIAVAIGALLGVVNGIAVAYLRIPSLVATLGTMSIFRGILYASAGGRDLNTDQLPNWLLNLVSSSVLGIPTVAVIAIGVALAAGLLLHRSQFGRTLFAVGSNPHAAAFYGLPLRRTILKTYAFSGALAGIAGILLAGEVGTVTVDIASGWELQTLAAAVIGGISLLGGSGTVTGAVLGALILTTIDNGLIQAGASGDWQNFVRGVVIVVAVALDLLWQHRRSGRLSSFGRAQAAKAG